MRTGLESHTGVAASPDAAQHAEAIGHLLARIDQTAAQIGDLFPLSADPQTGTWMTAPDGRWTGGFWCGQLWLALQASGDAKYRVLAENALQRLQGRLESDNVLNGLVFYYAAALGKQLHQSQAGAALGALGAEESLPRRPGFPGTPRPTGQPRSVGPTSRAPRPWSPTMMRAGSRPAWPISNP